MCNWLLMQAWWWIKLFCIVHLILKGIVRRIFKISHMKFLESSWVWRQIDLLLPLLYVHISWKHVQAPYSQRIFFFLHIQPCYIRLSNRSDRSSGLIPDIWPKISRFWIWYPTGCWITGASLTLNSISKALSSSSKYHSVDIFWPLDIIKNIHTQKSEINLPPPPRKN